MASSLQTVAEALRARLAAITAGGGYVYTPSAVKTVSFWPTAIALDPSLSVIYLVRPGALLDEPYGGCGVDERAEFLVLCAARFTEPTENPFLAGAVRFQMAADMAADVKQKVREDVRLANPTLVVDAWGPGISADFDLSEPQWALVTLRLVIRYTYPQGSR